MIHGLLQATVPGLLSGCLAALPSYSRYRSWLKVHLFWALPNESEAKSLISLITLETLYEASSFGTLMNNSI